MGLGSIYFRARRVCFIISQLNHAKRNLIIYELYATEKELQKKIARLFYRPDRVCYLERRQHHLKYSKHNGGTPHDDDSPEGKRLMGIPMVIPNIFQSPRFLAHDVFL